MYLRRIAICLVLFVVSALPALKAAVPARISERR